MKSSRHPASLTRRATMRNSQESSYDINHFFSNTNFSDIKRINMPVLEIDCRTVHSRLESEESFLLLDCREQTEYDLVHIEEAVLLPMSEIQDRVAELKEHSAKEIIVYCHHGMRSLQVTQWLLQQGFENVKSMNGGIDAWASEIDTTMAKY